MLLDLDNPRLGSTSSQSEALASIVRLNPGYFQNLMGSIRDDGLDPGDSLYVVRSEDGQDFVVLEGNRRLSAFVKGGVKLDHSGGEKVDQFRGGGSFDLRELRGRLERKPATPAGRRG